MCCCTDRSSDLAFKLHLIFVAAFLNSMSRYKVTVPPRKSSKQRISEFQLT